MLKHFDIQGFYRILGVQPQVDGDDIKRAYRRLAKSVHPDRHRCDPDATAKFQRLAEAYETLGNPERRAQYDSASLIAYHYELRPLLCARCGTISLQLRYAIFTYILGFSLAKPCRTFEGLYCARCAQAKSLQAVMVTWLVGWWRIPKGPPLSIRALFQILVDDSYPADKNADILMQQATYYLSMGQIDLASNILSHVEQFVKTGIASQRLAELRRHIPLTAPSRDEWRIRRRWSLGIQLAPFVLVTLVIIAIGSTLNTGKNSAAFVTQRRDGGVLVIDARGSNGK
jgi:hypothetical protein